MNRKTLFAGISLLCAGFLLFESCSNLFGSHGDSSDEREENASAEIGVENTVLTFTGSIDMNGAFPKGFLKAKTGSAAGNDRSALPSIGDGEDLRYFVTASKNGGSGSVSIDSGSDPASFDSSDGVKFAIAIESGNWKVEAGVKDSRGAVLMSDSCEVELSAENPAANYVFYPKPSQGGTGLVGLSMTVPDSVNTVEAVCGDEGWQVDVNLAVNSVTVMTKNMTSGGKTKSGTYEVVFSFYDSNGILMYATAQSVNVFDNMTTDSWSSDGSGIIDGSGKFILTEQFIATFWRTTFYVGDTSVGRASDTSGSGSPYAPFATISKAAQTIKDLNDGSSEFRIFVCQNLDVSTLSESVSLVPSDKAINLTVQSYPTDGSAKYSIDGGGRSFEGALVKIAGKSKTETIVILKNIAVTGHKNSLASASNGGGLLCDRAEVLLENCELTGNECADNGGGIFTAANSIVTIKNSVVSGNTAKYGGGIYNSASLVLNGASVENNTATTYGGGIYNKDSAEVYVYGGTNIKNNTVTGMSYGGAVYNASSLYLGFDENKTKTEWSGEMSGNTASQGSAIWTAASTSIYFDSGTIKGKTTASSSDWGILLMGTGTFELSGSARVDSSAPVYFCPFGSEDILPTFKLVDSLSAESPVATFTMRTGYWKRGQTILTAGEGVTITKEIADKFAFTEDGWELVVASDGKTAYMDSPIYVAAAGNDTSGTGSRSNPFATIEKASSVMSDASIDYSVFINGKVTGSQAIPSTVTSEKAKSITIQGVNGVDENGVPKDSLDAEKNGTTLTLNSTVPVTIENLKITGGSGTNVTENSVTQNRGGGIYMASGTNVTLGTGALVGDATLSVATSSSCGNYANFGGGIYNEGSLTLGSGAIVRHNYASPFGGGIWNEGGSVTIKEGAEISYNCAGISDARGGGIRSGGSGSSLSMEGGTISHNSVSHWGGGVMIQGSVFTMTGGTISSNKSTGSSSIGAGGGGIWIDDGTFKMSGDSILSGNEANNKGGGIHVEHEEATVEILGGTISGNKASVSGGAISNNLGKITISGGTIPYGVLNASGSLEKGAGKNDVYLPSGKVITVTGSLTGTSPVATITPATWTRGTSIVQADGTNVGDISGYKNFFAFSEDGWEWKVSGDNKSLLLDSPIYVASKGTDSSRKVCAAAVTENATGSKSKPFATIEAALSVLNAESNVITIDGNVVGNQQILLSKVPSSVTSVAIAGYKESGAASSSAKLTGTGSGTVLSVNMSGREVTVEDLTITGGNFSYGGGLAVDNGTVKLLDGAKITENTATEKGGGVYLGPSAKLVMEGSATISGNSAASGGAVYNAGSFNMGGSAYIPYGVTKASGTVETGAGKNDVYLESDKTITITDSLTGTAPVATITPASYVFDISVLGGTSSLIAANYKKFAVVPQTVDDKSYEWFVSSTGILYTAEYLITSDSLASFSPNSSVSFKLTVDSTVGNDELSSLISKMNNNGVGAGTTLDLSESSATNLTTWIETKVSSITIPKNCTNIDSQEFQSAEWLTEINVPETNTSYCSVDGVLYSKDMKKLVHYPPSKADSTFTLPSTVTTFAYGAFEDNKYLETINGMTQITTLEDMVTFRSTQKLKEIDLSSLTNSSLPYYTFEYSTALEKVTLSSSITSIGLQCFQGSSSLTEVHFKSATPPVFAEPKEKEDLDYYKNFKNCPNVKFYVPSSAVDSYKNATGEKEFVNTDYNGSSDTTAGIQAKIVGE